MRFLLIAALPALAAAQLIPAGQPVPKGPNPPVVFVNGYQAGCTGTDFASNFFSADQLLQANSIVTLYFDNCTLSGVGPTRPSIEAEGAAFGQFLAGLKYTDGTQVTQVDVVGHSMGGLIIRSYLRSQLPHVGSLPPVRRAVFLGTPNFGTPLATLLGSGVDKQLDEMSPGSQFLFDLNSWNDGTDDLQGISAIAIAGNAGRSTSTSGFDDGVVELTSASLGFYRPNVTRVVPDCHTADSLLYTVGYCPSGAPSLNNITNDPNNLVGQILISFLTGTNAWQSVGQPIESVASASATAGTIIQLRDMNDAPITATAASATLSPAVSVSLSANQSSGLIFTDQIGVGKYAVNVKPLTGMQQTGAVDLTNYATTEAPEVVKPGPVISPRGIIPAAGPAPFPFDVAAGAYVSIYGSNLAEATQQSPIPYPTQIGDVQVLVNNVPQQLVFVSPGQINFVYSNADPGLTQVTVKNMNGQNTLNMRVAAAAPSLFLLDANGTAAAVNALTGAVVGPGAPLHAGDFVSVYLTGLGATVNQNGLDVAQVIPVLTIGGQNIRLQYAGRTPGYAGLDQINAQLPAGIPTGASVSVTVTSAGRTSNTATIAIQ